MLLRGRLHARSAEVTRDSREASGAQLYFGATAAAPSYFARARPAARGLARALPRAFSRSLPLRRSSACPARTTPPSPSTSSTSPPTQSRSGCRSASLRSGRRRTSRPPPRPACCTPRPPGRPPHAARGPGGGAAARRRRSSSRRSFGVRTRKIAATPPSFARCSAGLSRWRAAKAGTSALGYPRDEPRYPRL